jgi:tetratricopeptide (TPR) repeat protein
MSQQALAIRELGELNEAIALGKQVLGAQERILGADNQATLATKNNLAVAFWKAGRSSDAGALLEQIRDVLVKTLGADHAQTLDALDNLSGVYVGVGRGTEAIALAKQVRDARIKKYGVDHPLAIASMNNLAFRYSAVGNMRQALALFEEARDAIVPRLGNDNPMTLIILDNLARMYRAFGRTREAIPLAEQVRDTRVRTLGVYHRETIHTLGNLGLAYQAAGQSEKALSLFKQAADGLEKLEFNHEEAGLIVENLCDCLEKQGQTDRADVWRQKWLAAVKKKDGLDSTAYVGVLEEQGENMLRVERHANAERILRECLAIRQRKQPEAWSTFYVQSLLGEALLGQKKYAVAEPVLIPAYEGLLAREGQIPPLYARHRIAEAGERIVQLYEAWGRAEKAAEWRTKLPKTGHAKPKQ